ncbi:MAG: spinster family MFS transporter [bacterium]
MVKGRVISPVFALCLLLGLNLLNYADRSVLSALEVKIEGDILAPGDPYAKTKMGALMFAFLVSYMLLAPVFGILADRWRRWWIVGLGVIGGGLASFGTGLAPAFGVMFLMRALVGVSEAAYGPAAPTLISDMFAVDRRGRALSWFYLAIPVGSALGYVYGGLVGGMLGWRWAFYLLLVPAVVLGVICFFLTEPKRGQSEGVEVKPLGRAIRFADVWALLRIKSLFWNFAGGTAMTFAIGGIAFFMPRFICSRLSPTGVIDDALLSRVNVLFGGVVVVTGLVATLAGGMLADKLRTRFPGAYLSMSGTAMLLGFPMFLGVLFAPFPMAWVFVGLTVFFVFLNTGPSNAAVANVTHPAIRSTAFAVNNFVIHVLVAAICACLIGFVADVRGKLGDTPAVALQWGFGLVGLAMLLAGVFWLIGSRTLAADTANASKSLI